MTQTNRQSFVKTARLKAARIKVTRLLVLGCCTLLAVSQAQALPATQINNFETAGEQGQVTPTPPVTKVISTIVSSPTTGVTHGTNALKLNFKVGGGSYPTANITFPTAQDWSGSGALAMSIYNPGATDVTFYLRLDDSTSSDYLVWINTVKAGQSITVQQSLFTNSEIAANLAIDGYQKIPWANLGDDRAIYVDDTSPPNRASISQLGFQLETAPVGADVNLVIDNLHLVPGPKIDAAYAGTSNGVNSFENATEQSRVSIAHPGKLTTTYQTSPGGGMVLDGTQVMKVVWNANPGVGYPGLRITPPDSPADWLGMPGAGLAFNIYNPGASALPLGIQIKDDSGATNFRYASIPAASTAKWVMPFLSRAGLNNTGLTDMSSSSNPGSVDLQHITEILVYYNTGTGPTVATTAYFDYFRVVKGNVHLGISDKYGQYTRSDWPGKVYSDSDLTAQRSTEAADLAANPTLSNRDIYGGWTLNPTGLGSGNGYFRTWYDSTRNKWWFVDPLGNRFFSTGFNSMMLDLDKTFITANAPGTLDRTDWFQAGTMPVPGSGDPLAAFYDTLPTGKAPFPAGGLAYSFFEANVYRKYFPGSGANWATDWKNNQLTRLKSWGFNTVGAWSNGIAAQINAPFVIAITSVHGGHMYKRFTTPYQAHSTMPDPWDKIGNPSTTGLYRAVLANLGAAYQGDQRTNTYLIGYMVDNELSWGIESAVDNQRYNIAYGVLQTNASTVGASPAKDVFIADMVTKYGTVAALNAAWGTAFSTGSTIDALLRPIYNPPASLTAGQETDFGNFITKYSDKYFNEVNAAINAWDANHLYLGCRFAQYTRRSVKEAAKYVDVLSFNYYSMFYVSDWNWLSDVAQVPTQKPAMITEFSYGATDRGLFGPTGTSRPDTQAGRAAMMDLYFTNVSYQKSFVGAHWFQYTDEPLLGRNLDGETGNYGMLSVTDTPFSELVTQARITNGNVYGNHY
jgi:hypothetical protein